MNLRKRVLYIVFAGVIAAGIICNVYIDREKTLYVQAAETVQEMPAESVFPCDTDVFSSEEQPEELSAAPEGVFSEEPEPEPSEEPESEPSEEPEAESVAEPELSEEPAEEPAAEPAPIPESVSLVPDEGLEKVPYPMLPCLEDRNAVKALLHYSDGSEQLLTGERDTYGNTGRITYEDTVCEDGSVNRTYTLQVILAQPESGAALEASETVRFQQEAGENITDIKAQEKTKVGYSGKKSWILIESVPEVTGRYSMQSFGKKVKELYYLADGTGAVLQAEDAFALEAGVRYTFLLKLE